MRAAASSFAITKILDRIESPAGTTLGTAEVVGRIDDDSDIVETTDEESDMVGDALVVVTARVVERMVEVNEGVGVAVGPALEVECPGGRGAITVGFGGQTPGGVLQVIRPK